MIRVHLTPITLVVMVEPPLSVACRVATEDGTDEHRTDELGELVVDAPDLPLRVEVDLPSGTVVTPWITGLRSQARYTTATDQRAPTR